MEDEYDGVGRQMWLVGQQIGECEMGFNHNRKDIDQSMYLKTYKWGYVRLKEVKNL